MGIDVPIHGCQASLHGSHRYIGYGRIVRLGGDWAAKTPAPEIDTKGIFMYVLILANNLIQPRS